PLTALSGAWDSQDVCPGVALDSAARVEDAVARRKWANAAYARKRADRECGLEIEHATAATFDSHFSAVEALHAARWRARGGPGVLGAAATRAFHRDAARRLLERGALLLFVLRLGGETAGALYGFRDRAAVRYYLSGFDPAHARRSPNAM